MKHFSDHLCTAVENGQGKACTREDEGAPLTIADKDRSFKKKNGKFTLFAFCRHTLVGITLGCAQNMPQIFTNFLSKSVVNFVLKVVEDRCGVCGLENEGEKLNKMPWFVAIKERVDTSYVYHSGALVSGNHVVTAASIFQKTPFNKENFEALVGATNFAVVLANAYPGGKVNFLTDAH